MLLLCLYIIITLNVLNKSLFLKLFDTPFPTKYKLPYQQIQNTTTKYNNVNNQALSH